MENLGGLIGLAVALALAVGTIAAMWKTFQKAGQDGWACLVPIYNIYVMTCIAKKPGWFVLLFFVPLANLVAAFLVLDGISKNFNKGTGFTLGLMFLSPIFFAILGFGDAVYGAPKSLPPLSLRNA